VLDILPQSPFPGVGRGVLHTSNSLPIVKLQFTIQICTAMPSIFPGIELEFLYNHLRRTFQCEIKSLVCQTSPRKILMLIGRPNHSF